MSDTAAPYFDLRGKRIWVAGHRGLIGSALVRRLASEVCEIVTVDRSELDLLRQSDVERWLSDTRPDAIIVAAAKVGGILANQTYPATFIQENLVVQSNIVEAAHKADVNRVLFLGSSCIYPKFADQPITEDALLTGPLEPTNEWYAIAKIAGIKLAEAYRRQYGRDYISAMPTNLYGPGDNFDLKSGHVIPAILRKVHEAKIGGAEAVTIWGTGSPRREFLYVDDCADGLVFLLQNYTGNQHINVGSGEDLTILELTHLICDVVGFDGSIVKDHTKPDGTPRKLMSAGKIKALGWAPTTPLREGLEATYDWFVSRYG